MKTLIPLIILFTCNCGPMVVTQNDLDLSQAWSGLERGWPLVQDYYEFSSDPDVDVYGLLDNLTGIRQACIGELNPHEYQTSLSCYHLEGSLPPNEEWHDRLNTALQNLDELRASKDATPESSGWFYMLEGQVHGQDFRITFDSDQTGRHTSSGFFFNLSHPDGGEGMGYRTFSFGPTCIAGR